MNKFLSLLLKIFLAVLLAFVVLCCIPVPALILPTISLCSLIWCLWFVIKKTKLLSENAKVLSKIENARKFYVTFEFADGTRKTMPSPVEVYGCILEGEYGIVSYKEYRNNAYLVDFQRNKGC